MASPHLRLLPASALLATLFGIGGCACFRDTRYATENSNLRDDARIFVTPRCDPAKQYACGTFDVVIDATHPLPSSLQLVLAPACTWSISLSRPSNPTNPWRYEADLACADLVPERRYRLVLRSRDSVHAASDFRYTQYHSESCSE
jgi:hypothetical protein